MWDPQHLTTLEASTVCHGDRFLLYEYTFTLGIHDSLHFLKLNSLKNSEHATAGAIGNPVRVSEPLSFESKSLSLSAQKNSFQRAWQIQE
jgi:hypothetical protein